MKVLTSFDQAVDIQAPVVLTIGNFDGVHLGHQALFDRLKEVAKKQHGLTAVLTFKNHPSEVVKPTHRVSALSTPHQKLNLLEKAGIDLVYMVKFTHQFSQQTAEELIEKIRKRLPFTALIMGHDAVIGKDRHGNRDHLMEIAKKDHFDLEYIEPVSVEGTLVSSSKIRELIKQGKVDQAEKLLGHPVS